MKRKTKLILVTVPAVILLAFLAFFLMNRQNPLYIFPLWQDVPQRETTEAAELSFECIEYGYETAYGTKHDGVRITLRNLSGEALGYGEGFAVDYLYEGAYHTIYMPESITSIGIMLAGYGRQEQTYLVPEGLFTLPGTYRLYIDGMGDCEFHILTQD